jgi:AcrR family transcriptional regulator
MMKAAAGSKAAAKRWDGAEADRDERHRTKRRAILDRAARLFAQRGYGETTLDDIARELAVTKPTLYYYVRSKEDILVQILEAALTGALAAFAEVHREGRTGLERLRLFVRRWVEDMTHPYGRCLLTMRATPLGAKTRARLNVGFRQLDALVRELIADGIGDGSIAACDVRMATFAIFGAINTVPFWYRAGGVLTPREAGDALFAVMARGIAAPGEVSP